MSDTSSETPKAGIIRLPHILLLAFAFFSFGAIGAFWGSWQNLCIDCPSIAQISTWEPEQTSKLLSYDERLIAEIGLERRTCSPRASDSKNGSPAS
jgi:membrane carboxypeptidase/penicillin-binding protein